jgi:hypothetical protein
MFISFGHAVTALLFTAGAVAPRTAATQAAPARSESGT